MRQGPFGAPLAAYRRSHAPPAPSAGQARRRTLVAPIAKDTRHECPSPAPFPFFASLFFASL